MAFQTGLGQVPFGKLSPGEKTGENGRRQEIATGKNRQGDRKVGGKVRRSGQPSGQKAPCRQWPLLKGYSRSPAFLESENLLTDHRKIKKKKNGQKWPAGWFSMSPRDTGTHSVDWICVHTVGIPPLRRVSVDVIGGNGRLARRGVVWVDVGRKGVKALGNTSPWRNPRPLFIRDRWGGIP